MYAQPRGKHAGIMVRNPAIDLVGVEKVDDKDEKKASVVHFAEWLVGEVHGQARKCRQDEAGWRRSPPQPQLKLLVYPERTEPCRMPVDFIQKM